MTSGLYLHNLRTRLWFDLLNGGRVMVMVLKVFFNRTYSKPKVLSPLVILEETVQFHMFEVLEDHEKTPGGCVVGRQWECKHPTKMVCKNSLGMQHGCNSTTNNSISVAADT